MSSLLVLLLVGAPVAAAGVAATIRTGGRAALTVAASGAVASLTVAATGIAALALDLGPLQVGPADAPWLRLDGPGALLAIVASLVTATVTAYARNHLDGDAKAGAFATAALVLLGGTLVLATATTLQLGAAAWLVASAATVALCRYRGDPVGRRVARRSLVPLLSGDAAILAAAAIATATAGAVHFGDAGRELSDRTLAGPIPVPVGPLVVALVAVGAIARAGQVPFRPWMTTTVDAPTPVSALLHAGSVNAGGFLLVRSSDLLWEAPAVRLALGASAVATMGLAAAAVWSRPDTKGRLATSTAGQMGVMLLAAAIGAPAVVLTHLAGHSLYKSARFLGAGDAVRGAVAARRAAAGAPDRPRWARTALTGVAASVAVAAWLALAALVDLAAIETGATAGLIGALVASGARAATAVPGVRAVTTALVVALAAGGLAGGALVAHQTLSLSHPELVGGGLSAFVPIAAALAAVAALGRPGPLVGVAGRWATAPIRGRPPVARPPAPAPVVVASELGRSW